MIARRINLTDLPSAPIIASNFVKPLSAAERRSKMEEKSNKIYFPLFYKYTSLVPLLTREEFGEIVCAILISGGTLPPKDLSPKLEDLYKLIIKDAERLFERNLPKRTCKKGDEPRVRYGNFDPNRAYELALRRSYQDIK